MVVEYGPADAFMVKHKTSCRICRRRLDSPDKVLFQAMNWNAWSEHFWRHETLPVRRIPDEIWHPAK
jgi:hypothetical protein